MEKFKKILDNVKFKWLRQTSLTILLLAIIIGIFIGLNVGLKLIDLGDIDLTKEKTFTLTDESKEQVAKLPSEDKVQIYMFDYSENDSIVDLTKQYSRANENISVEIIDTSERPDLVSEYQIIEDSYMIAVICGDKHKVIGYNDLFSYDYNTGKTTDIAEQRLTNTIISVSSLGQTIPIYILTGHDEYSMSTVFLSLSNDLNMENYELKELDLLIEERVPENCSTLIIASPAKDFTELEANKIKDYINAGGNILWMNDIDPINSKEPTPNIQSILDLYGVTINKDGAVFEQDTTRILMNTPDMIFPYVESSDILTTESVLLVDTGKLTFVDNDKLSELNVTKTDLLSTSTKSFYRTDFSQGNQGGPTDKEEKGGFVVGALLSKEIGEDKTSNLIVYANNAFATDVPITIGNARYSVVQMYNNMDAVLNSIAYLAKVEDKITIRKDTREVTSYTATQSQHSIVVAVISIVPSAIIIIGIIVWALRRRKK